MKAAFTIVAQNYIGLAKILEQSFLEKNKDADFVIFVSDEYDGVETDVIEARTVLNISQETWQDMCFKYDITEFCTAIKPFCFSYLFSDRGYDIALYFDPDIYVFSSLDDVFDKLTEKTFYLTPHIVTPDSKPNDDRVFLQSGIYNLGFIGISSSSEAKLFLAWWESRLMNLCFDDLFSYTFTDQKWANFIPAFFPEKVFVSTHLGMNFAPWNYFERQVIFKDDKFYVKNRIMNSSDEYPLLFVHYSGFNYKELIEGKVSRNRRGAVEIYEDVTNVLDFYKEVIIKSINIFSKYIDLPYSYGVYKNGDKIDRIHRRIYRNMTENNIWVESPFCTGKGSFYSKIASRGMITNSNVNRLSQESVSQLDSKSRFFCRIMKMVYRVLGYKRYLQLLKFLKYFSRYEAQAFLIEPSMTSHVLPK